MLFSTRRIVHRLTLNISFELAPWARILVQITIYHRLRIGHDEECNIDTET